MPASETSRDGLAAALDFHRHAGVDIALGDAPRDRIAEARAEAERAIPATPLARAPHQADSAASSRPNEGGETRPARATDRGARPAPPPLPQAARPLNPALAADAAAVEQSAAELAASARTLDELRENLDAFDGCALKITATQLVFEDGARNARVHFVGEAPGAEEDREGRPFVGRAGQLLDKMLAAIDLDRMSAYISNVIPWRPPGNRTPSPLETSACLPFTLRQIELVGADFLICLGAPSMQALLGASEGILKTRGRWMACSVGARVIPAMAMLHPAYLLRQPLQKRLAWRDLRALRRALDGEAPDLGDA